MEIVQSLFLGILPGAFWLWYLHGKDDYEPEPWSIVLIAFALGGVSTFGVLHVRPFVEDLLPWGNGWDRALADAFLVTAPLEEAMKTLAFVLAIAWHHELDEPLDGVIYGSAVGLGFASAESVHYLLEAEKALSQLELVGLRAFTATLVHVTATATIGFCLGLQRFVRARMRGWIVLAGGFLAVLTHGLYDVFLFAGGAVFWAGKPLSVSAKPR